MRILCNRNARFAAPVFLAAIVCATAAPRGANADLTGDERRANIPDIDYHTLSTVEVPCRDDTEILLNNRPCKDTASGPGFYSTVEKLVRHRMHQAAKDARAGFGFDWDTTSYQGANASIPMYGECVSPNDNAVNNTGHSCGKFCDISVSLGLGGVTVSVRDNGGASCRREYGYYQGLRLQTMNRKKVEVLGQFKNGGFPLVDFDGVKPCAPLAADALKLLMAANAAVEQYVSRYGREKAEKAACKALGPSGASGATGFDGSQFGDCAMIYAQAGVFVQWQKLLNCEIGMRAKKFLYLNSVDQGKWFDDAKNAVGDKCKGEVCKACSDGDRTSDAMKCYKREMPPYVKSRMQGFGIDTPGDPMEKE